MTIRSQRSGRKDSTERMRELIAILGSLSHTGDAVTIDAISSRMGISHNEAADMMNIVCQASGEESSGLLISANDDMTEFVLQYPQVHGRPIRLTNAETVALTHALDLVGIEQDDEIRSRLKAAFTSPEIEERDVRNALGTRTEAPTSALYACAQAQAEQYVLDFWYQGVRDNAPRRRHAAVDKIFSQENVWYIEARDLDILQHRTFRVDRMTEARLGAPIGGIDTHEQPSSPKSRMVEIAFADERYLTMFDWPGLVIQSRTTETIHGRIPYYGEGNDWLIRRLASCGGDVLVHDRRIMRLTYKYIQQQLM